MHCHRNHIRIVICAARTARIESIAEYFWECPRIIHEQKQKKSFFGEHEPINQDEHMFIFCIAHLSISYGAKTNSDVDVCE